MEPRTSTLGTIGVVMLAGATLIGPFGSLTEAHAADLLRNGGFERSTVRWTPHGSNLERVTPGVASAGAARLRPSHRVRRAVISQAATRRTAAAVRYRATAWVRAKSGKKLCLRVREWRRGSRVDGKVRCQRATGRWQALLPVTYRARGEGHRLLVSVYELRAGPRSTFRVDRVHLKRVEEAPAAVDSGSAPAGPVIKLIDSRNASDTLCSEGGGSLSRGELGDTFLIPEQPAVQTSRCSWHDYQFSKMGRHEVFDVELRWDQYAEADSSHAGIIYLRPTDPNLSSGCDGGGNSDNMLVRVYVDWADSPDHWKLQLRGGESPWPIDQSTNLTTVDLGPVVEGVRLNLKFALFFDYAHGAATVWKDGIQVYSSQDRPLGFHYNCTYRSSATAAPNADATVDSAEDLRMQHGIYRNTTPAWTLESSGFRFYCSQTVPC